jgi:hypothetical protein
MALFAKCCAITPVTYQLFTHNTVFDSHFGTDLYVPNVLRGRPHRTNQLVSYYLTPLLTVYSVLLAV